MCYLSIKELSVQNYRRFPTGTFVLNPRMNVFAGRNGSGKTTLLEASAVILGAYLRAFSTYVPARHAFNISEKDAHLKTLISRGNSIMTTGGIPQYPCKVSCKVVWDRSDNIIEFQRELLKEGGRTRFGGSNPMQNTVQEWEEKIAQANHLDEEQILPIVLYLSSGRLWNDYRSSNKPNSVFSRTEAYSRCLDGKHGTDIAFEYIQQLRYVSLEERDGATFASYDAILNAVNVAFQEELGEGEKVIFSTRYGQDVVALKKADGTVIPFASLSDGYRNVIKIILDIATRMCILNPYLQGEALEKTPGVVIIDEIDLSLHPTWQKRIVRILKSLFPKVQFICATHSPFIIQSLQQDELITLDRDEKPLAEEYADVSIEDIAEDIMGVQIPQYSDRKIKMYEAAKEFFDALQQGRSKEDIEALREKMARLEAEYSDNPAYLAWMEQKFAAKELEVTSQ